MHPVVFSKEWFRRYQHSLVTLLNVPVLGKELKSALGIKSCDVGYEGKIIEILPHCYTVVNEDGTFTTDFRTHNKYAKRFYYQFHLLWRAMHEWDRFVANPLVPALNLGFDTFTTYPDPDPGITTCDGRVYRNGVSETWATIKAGAGVGTITNEVNAYVVMADWDSGVADRFQQLSRCFFLFDTSSIGAQNIITDATLSFYGRSKTDFGSSNSPSVNVYSATPASNTTLATGDFNNVGSTAFSTTITYAAFDTAAYNDFVLNSSGLANISETGISKFSTREPSYDVGSSTPVWSFFNLGVWGADQAGTSNDTKLVVTYSSGGWPYGITREPGGFTKTVVTQ